MTIQCASAFDARAEAAARLMSLNVSPQGAGEADEYLQQGAIIVVSTAKRHRRSKWAGVVAKPTAPWQRTLRKLLR